MENHKSRPIKANLRIMMMSLIIIFLCSEVATELRPRISEVNVKLPICRSKLESECRTVYYRLKGFDGCFDWELSENGNLLKLENLPTKQNKNCHKALISTKINYDPQTFAYITAIDKGTGYKFKIKVGFALIEKISVSKRFNSMNVGDSLELGVVAKDKNNNTFSSVEGLRFNWGFNKTGITKETSIAEFSKLSNGKMRFSDYRMEAEKTLYSDIVLISGLSTGKVEVFAELFEEGSTKKSSNKWIYIRQSFIIDPKELWILTNTSFDFKLFLIDEKIYDKYNQRTNNQSPELIPIIGDNIQKYLFELEVKKCGLMNSNNMKSGGSPCENTLKVKDTRLEEFNNAVSKIHVVEPDNLELGYKEVSSASKEYKFTANWNLIARKQYKVKNFLRFNNQAIVFSSSVIFNTKLDELVSKGHIQILERSQNGASLIIETLTITSSFLEAQSVVLEPKVSSLSKLIAKKKVRIFNPISIEKFGQPKFYLPFIFPHQQRLELIINGGSGSYEIESSNENVIVIKKGILFSNQKGVSTIRVIDREIDYNLDVVDVEVKTPLKFSSLEEKQEVLIDEKAQVTVISSHNQIDFNIFTNCTDINPLLSVDDNDLFSETSKDFLKEVRDNPIETGLNDRIIQLFPNSSNEVFKLYLKYANYGACGRVFLKSSVPRLYTLQSLNLILNSKESYFTSNKPQIQFYQGLTQIYPKTNDIHDLKMLGKQYGEYVESTIIISPLSNINVEFDNGLSPWAEDPSKFLLQSIIYRIENEVRKEISSNYHYRLFKLKVNEIPKKSINLECWKEADEDYEIEVSVGTVGLKSLMNPKRSSVRFRFSCTSVSRLSMNFEDDYDRDDVLSHPQNVGIMYSRQINSFNTIRVYALDNKLRLLSSFKGEFGKITEKKELLDIREEPNSPLYYHKITLNLGDYIGLIPVEYSTLSETISHNLFIKSVNHPYIFPQESKIFLYESNFSELEILNGSGEFEITNSDFSIAIVEYNPKVNPRKIKVYPKKTGLISISLKDKKFSLTSIISVAKVVIADIHKIFIIAPNYLMVGNKLKALVKVYDKYGSQFDESQVIKMNLQINKHEHSAGFNGTSLSKLLVITNEIVTFIELQGLSEGIQALSLISINGNESNVVHIQVFDKLEVFPPQLLLYPGAAFTLKIVGGPENEKSLNKIYSINNPEIASIGKSSPRVVAKTIGITTIKVSLRYRAEENQLYSTEDEKDYYNKLKNTIFCEVDVPVQVAFPERIEIEGANNRKIYVDSIIRVISSLKLGDISFSYGIGNAEYSWSADNPLLAQFSNRNKAAKNNCSLPPSSESGDTKPATAEAITQEIGSFLISYGLGQVSLKLTIKINYPEPYVNHRPNVFTVKKIISIEENVWFDVAEFYDKDPNKSSLYLLPLGVVHQLQTHKHEQIVTYSIIKSSSLDVIKLSKTGRVETSLQNGLTMVQIDKAGQMIPTVLNIYVTSYHSIFAENSHKVIVMEAGAELNLKLAIQHESGLLFATSKDYYIDIILEYENLGLMVVESDPRIVKAEIHNNSSHIKLIAYKQGQSNIIVYHKSSRKILDVFRVGVDTSLTIPAKFNLSIDSKVQLFKNDAKKLSYIENLDAHWVSINPSVADVTKSGEINTSREGSTTLKLVKYNGQKVYLSTEVNVYSLNTLSLELHNLPNYITLKKTHSNYKSFYK